MKDFTYNGITINFNDDELTNLTRMWKAVEGNANQKPQKWLRQENTQKFLESLKKDLKGLSNPLLRITKGRLGGTYSHWQIATAYAKYLSTDLHVEFNKHIKQHIYEEEFPEEGVERTVQNYVKKYKRLGKSDEWINTRLIGITQRNTFTSEIGKIKNMNKNGYGMITDDMNLMLLGDTASGIKKKKKVKTTRDGLSASQLMILSLGEELAAEALKKKNVKAISKGEAIDTVLDAIDGLSKVATPFKLSA